MNILVTRPHPNGLALCQAIQALGLHPIHFPVIEFVAPTETQDNLATLKQLGQQDWLIFTSPQAVYSSVAMIRQAWPAFAPHLQIAAIGASTAHALKQAGYLATCYPEQEWNTEGLLAQAAFQAMQGKTVTIIRGEQGRPLLAQRLQALGAKVSHLITYKRTLPTINTLVDFKVIDVSICTSNQALENLKHLAGEKNWPLLLAKPLIVASQRVKDLAQALGFQTIWIASNNSQTAILAVLEDKL